MQIRMDEKGRILFMATYVISDIHGEYERFMELLEEIELKDTDTLYVLGDVLDRGEHPIKVILKLMEMPNAFCIVGNHEVMALECLRFLCQEITDPLRKWMLNCWTILFSGSITAVMLRSGNFGRWIPRCGRKY